MIIQHKPVHCKALGHLSKTFQLGGGEASTATILPHPSQRASRWLTTENKTGMKTEQNSLALAAPAAL